MAIKNKKIYIAGAGGMLGHAFYEHFKKNNHLECSDKDKNEHWLKELDFTFTNKYFEEVKNFNPDYLFHIGAITSLEECELNQDLAYKTNYLAVEDACKLSNYLKIPLIYISTAGIFDGKKDFYNDWDLPNPLGVYAHSKFLGEQTVINNAHQPYVFRAGWMMGGGPEKDKKFINKIIKQIKEGVTTLNIVNDKFGTPTYTHDFVKNIDLVLDNELCGIYNLVCEGVTSRADVTEEILKVLKLSKKISINLVNSDYFKKEYFAPRPYSERLINKKLNLRNLNIMRDWKVCLSEYLKTNYKI